MFVMLCVVPTSRHNRQANMGEHNTVSSLKKMNERFENGESRDQEYSGCSHSPVADANAAAATASIQFSIIIPNHQRAI